MVEYFDVGFKKQRIREMSYPFTVTIRLGDSEQDHAEYIKNYLAAMGDPAINTSDLFRRSLLFAKVFCHEREAEIEQKKEIQEANRKAALAAPGVFVVEGVEVPRSDA